MKKVICTSGDHCAIKTFEFQSHALDYLKQIADERKRDLWFYLIDKISQVKQ